MGNAEKIRRNERTFEARTKQHARRLAGFLAAVLLLGLPTAAEASSHTVVTPDNMSGWSLDNQNLNASNAAPVGRFVEGPAAAPVGSGSFRQRALAGDKQILQTTNFNGVAVSSLVSNGLSFSTYTTDTAPTILTTALKLSVDKNADGFSDTTLVFEPYEQVGLSTGLPATATGVWQSWNAGTAGKWWSTAAADGGVGGTRRTLTQWLAHWSAPTATVAQLSAAGVRFEMGATSTWPDMDGNIDDVTINGTKYDFETAKSVVRPGSMGTWGVVVSGSNPNTSGTFVNGPGTPPRGIGSHRQTIGAASERVRIETSQFTNALVSALDISYSTYVSSNSGAQAPVLKIVVDQAGNGTGPYQTLKFEPTYQNGSYGTPNMCPSVPGCVAIGQWQTWDATVGAWWISGGGPSNPALTLASYAAMNPNARLLSNQPAGSVHIESGESGSTMIGFSGNVDKVTINGRSFDFDPFGSTGSFWTSPQDDATVRSADAPFVSATSDQDIEGSSTLTVRDRTNNLVAGSTTLAGPTSETGGKRTIRFTPTEAFTTAASPYTASLAASQATGPTNMTWSFSIDDAAPDAPVITVPADGGITNANPVVVTGTADANTTVRVKKGASTLAVTTADGSGNWSTPVSLSEGSHTLKATSTDAAGNVSADSTPVTFTVDRTAPTKPIIDNPLASELKTLSAVTIDGSAEANSLVEVYQGTDKIGQTTADAGGAWAITPSFADGTHTVTATATDAAGNVSAASDPRTFHVDTNIVDPVITAPADGALLNSTSVSVSGTAEAGNQVQIFEGASQVGSNLTADPSGVWSTTITFAGGSHTITAKATDLSTSVERISAAVTFTVDVSAPSAPIITTPAQDAVVGSTPTIAGTAENDADIEVFEGTTSLGTTTADGSGAWSLTSSALSEGQHEITAKATDAAGNASVASLVRRFFVDGQLPSLVSTNPADASVNGAVSAVTATYSEPLTGGTLEVRNVNNTLIAGTVSVSGDTVTFSPSGGNLNETGSPYTAKTTGTDTGNNTTSQATFSFVVDTSTPAKPVITSPADNSIHNTSSVTFSGTAEANSTVKLRRGATLVGTTTASPTGAWSLTVPLPDGKHEMTATATDAANNTSPSSDPVGVLVDTTAPAAPTISSPANGAALSSGSVLVQGTAEPDAEIDLRWIGHGQQGAPLFADGDGNWSYTLSVPDGSHQIRARQTDTAGNQGPFSATITFTVDTAAPDTTIDNGPSGLTNNADATFEFSSNEAGATFECKLDGGSFNACTSPKTYTGLADGSHTFEVRATDGVNTDATPATRNWTIDATAPGAPTIATPAQNAALANAAVTISGTAEASALVEVYEGATKLGQTNANGTGAWSLTHNFADGSHTVTAQATDAAGNTSASSAGRTFTVDTTAPNAPVITTPSEGAAFTTSSVTISGTAEANATVKVRKGSTIVATANADGAGAWSTNATFADGSHTIAATATDAVGNESSPSAGRTFSVDATAPNAPTITQPAEGSTVANSIVTITGTAEANSTVKVREGATLVGQAVANGTGGWTVNAPFSTGPHAITATATDAAGNESAASATRNFTVEPDTTPPAKPVITDPAAGSLHGSVVQIKGTAEPGSSITVKEGSVTVGQTATSNGGNWQLNANFSTGQHTITATARDAAGNVSDPSDPVTFEVDANRPTVTITTASNTVFGPDGDFTIEGTATDNKGVDRVEVEYYNLAGTKVDTVVVDIDPNGTNVTWEATAPDLLPGRYSVQVRSLDTSGLKSVAASASYIVLIVL